MESKNIVGASTMRKSIWKCIIRDKYLILLMFPAFLLLLTFSYAPMVGVVMAFQDFALNKGMFGSKWVGLKWFEQFFSSIYFGRLIRNTFLLSFYSLIASMPLSILFAILLNEMRALHFKKIVQSVSYFPYFISTVVVVGMLVNFLAPEKGIINLLLQNAGFEGADFMNDNRWFRTIYVSSEVWQTFGWNSIIYIGAITGIDASMYESATIDGANRFHQVIYITLPSIMPVIVTVLLLSIGNILNVGYGKIILMYSPATYETADIISSYVYRVGVQNAQYSLGTAVGLFNSVVNLTFILAANAFSKKLIGISLW